MLKRLKKCLDKIVQGIKKIFRKEKQNKDVWTVYSNTSLDLPTDYTPLRINTEPCTCTFTIDNAQINEELLLEKLSSTPLTNLPKCYSCKALILSVYGNQPWNGTGVDLSQYEEKGLAHFFVMRTDSPEELMKEYRQNHPDSKLEYNEGEDSISTVLSDAILIEYEDGIWDYI